MSAPGFADLFGRAPDVSVRAPGRVNLIGEHTDYNDGLVLPTTIPQDTRVELARSDGDTVRLWSANVGGDTALVSYRLGEELQRHTWIDFPQGVTAALRESGLAVRGFDARVESSIPLGSGLSSSAALLVALLRAVREAFALEVDDTHVARLAHRAECTLVGVPVGIMDQMASSLGRPGYALLLDTRSLHTEHIPIPAAVDLVVIDSGVQHTHAAGEYRTRRRECEEAAARLGVASLRDVAPGDDGGLRVDALPDVLARRARHVISENLRVTAMVAALAGGAVARCGEILQAGHASLRDDFEVSTPEIDALVAITCEAPGVLGARMTGGGFGGSIVALARAGTGRRAAETAAHEYARRTHRQATVVLPASP